MVELKSLIINSAKMLTELEKLNQTLEGKNIILPI